MSSKVFQDKTFPRHVSDLMNLMHMVVFSGTDGEEKWDTYLSLKQKEYIALALAQYHQCDHCIVHHLDALCKVESISKTTITKNVNSMVLFLRVNTMNIGESEKEHWINAWQRFAYNFAKDKKEQLTPYLIGLAIGITRNDAFLVQFCGKEVSHFFAENGIDARAAIGELESVVIFMKAAASKNRIANTIEQLF